MGPTEQKSRCRQGYIPFRKLRGRIRIPSFSASRDCLQSWAHGHLPSSKPATGPPLPPLCLLLWLSCLLRVRMFVMIVGLTLITQGSPPYLKILHLTTSVKVLLSTLHFQRLGHGCISFCLPRVAYQMQMKQIFR